MALWTSVVWAQTPVRMAACSVARPELMRCCHCSGRCVAQMLHKWLNPADGLAASLLASVDGQHCLPHGCKLEAACNVYMRTWHCNVH